MPIKSTRSGILVLLYLKIDVYFFLNLFLELSDLVNHELFPGESPRQFNFLISGQKRVYFSNLQILKQTEFYYGVVLIGDYLRSGVEECVLANKTNLEHELKVELVEGAPPLPPLSVMLVRCYPNVTFPRLQKDMTHAEEVKWGQQLSGKRVCFCLPDVCKSRPFPYQPCVGVREIGSLLDDVLGIHQCM